MYDMKSFLALLPGIKPLKARQVILNGSVLTPKQRADIHDRDSHFLDTVLLAGPDAAAGILRTYKAGGLPMQRVSTLPKQAPEVEAYVADGDRWRRQIAERSRLKRAASDLSILTEADLDNYRLLDSVFHAQLGPGGGTLTLAGILVTKSLLEYSSNSGRSRGWGVTFSWTASDGTAHKVEKVPEQARNRRNDPDRDYGLYE